MGIVEKSDGTVRETSDFQPEAYGRYYVVLIIYCFQAPIVHKSQMVCETFSVSDSLSNTWTLSHLVIKDIISIHSGEIRSVINTVSLKLHGLLKPQAD